MAKSRTQCRAVLLVTALSGWIALGSGMAFAQTAGQSIADAYPSKRVRILVGFTAGGTTDITARVVAEKLQARWGQPVLVENRPGGGSNIAADVVAKSPPDGYTLSLGVTGSHGINISLFKKLPYHPLKDFEPITQTTLYPNAIVAHPSFAANNIQEMIALARREPGKFVFATDGNGTGSHLTMELMLYKAGVKMQAVPYKGSSPMIADVIGNQAPVGITGITLVLNAYKAGKLKVLAITGLERTPTAPELQTVAEQGFPGFSGESWTGFFAPKGTPKPIVDKIAAEMVAAMHAPDVIRKMADMGTPLVGSGPEAFRTFVTKEIEKWAEGVRIAGVSVD